jgi:hypothetical protein
MFIYIFEGNPEVAKYLRDQKALKEYKSSDTFANTKVYNQL